jgi:hypothetical protein
MSLNFDINNLVTIATCIISGFFGYKVSKFSLKSPLKTKTLEKQLYYVYLPLFKKMEKNLYKSISPETALEYIDFFNDLKLKHYELIDGNLINVFQIFQKTTNKNSVSYIAYESVCQKIDKLFDSTRRSLFLPTRSLSYKINNRQFPKTYQNIFKVICSSLLDISIFTTVIIASYGIISIVQAFFNWIISIF